MRPDAGTARRGSWISWAPACLITPVARNARSPTAWRGAITEVAALHPECDLDSTATPSAAVAAARVLPSAERVEYLVLADTTVLLGRADKSEPDAISDRRVDMFAQAEVEAALRAPIGSDEHRDALTELVAAQRRLRNTPAGYWVAGADPRAAEQALTGTAALADVTDLALLTDGTSCIVTVFGELTDQQVLELLRHDGPGNPHQPGTSDRTGRPPRRPVAPIQDLRRRHRSLPALVAPISKRSRRVAPPMLRAGTAQSRAWSVGSPGGPARAHVSRSIRACHLLCMRPYAPRPNVEARR